jgi:hypothetical protein
MPLPRALRQWLRLPGRAALILGLGALSGAAARADTPDQAHRTALDDLVIRSEGGKIYFSERGLDFQELQLSDTAAARHLKQVIEHRSVEQGSAHIRLNSHTLAGGGGAGFYWWAPAGKTAKPDKAGTPGKPGKPEKAGTPRKTDTTETDKKG